MAPSFGTTERCPGADISPNQAGRILKALDSKRICHATDVFRLLQASAGQIASVLKGGVGGASVSVMSAANETTTYKMGAVTLELPNSILNDRMRKVLSAGSYELSEAQSLPKLVTEGDIVLELGAGVDFILTLAGRRRPILRQ